MSMVELNIVQKVSKTETLMKMEKILNEYLMYNMYILQT